MLDPELLKLKSDMEVSFIDPIQTDIPALKSDSQKEMAAMRPLFITFRGLCALSFSLSKGTPAYASSFNSLRFQFFSSEYAHIANETLFRLPPFACISEPSSGLPEAHRRVPDTGRYDRAAY